VRSSSSYAGAMLPLQVYFLPGSRGVRRLLARNFLVWFVLPCLVCSLYTGLLVITVVTHLQGHMSCQTSISNLRVINDPDDKILSS
jgi:hypothetical protein